MDTDISIDLLLYPTSLDHIGLRLHGLVDREWSVLGSEEVLMRISVEVDSAMRQR